MNKRALATASKVFLVVDILVLVGLILLRIFMTSAFLALYQDLGGTLPIMTLLVQYSHYIFIIIFLVLILKERFKNKLVTLLINVMMLFILVFGGLYFLIIGSILPLYRLGQMVG